MSDSAVKEYQFQDVLQSPLQPYKDNLESATYGVFEQDTAKYDMYEEAIYNALSSFKSDQKIVIHLVGAGRAPLVERALSANNKLGRNILIYAIEKNRYAFMSMQKKYQDCIKEWKPSVVLVLDDIKTWKAPEAADILLSELLGSFGDNELSPEII